MLSERSWLVVPKPFSVVELVDRQIELVGLLSRSKTNTRHLNYTTLHTYHADSFIYFGTKYSFERNTVILWKKFRDTALSNGTRYQ